MRSRPAITDSESRSAAARLLRDARHASAEDRRQAAERAHAALPASRAARRLHAEALLESGLIDEADEVIASGLLLEPTDPTLALLRARVLVARDALDGADRELHLALASRPEHGATLLLAADVATAKNDLDRAARLAGRAVATRPSDEGLREHYVGTLLASGQIAVAASELEAIGDESTLLTAQLLAADGRLDEAARLLESVLEDATADATERLLVELLPMLVQLEEPARLRHALERVPADRPAAMRLAAPAWLDLGDADQAARLSVRLARWPHERRDALHVLVVAAAMGERTGLARRALRRLELTSDGVDATLMAECWRRGLSGRLLADRDPPIHSGVVRSMLRRARRAFDQALADGSTDAAERAELIRHRAVCLAVIGSGSDRSSAA